MQVKTGKGAISIMVVLAIWSLSLAVDLPGLAVTPIEGQLHSIFPDVTDFKVQLLTMLPNVVIIPFVLLGGKLSETRHKIAVIVAGIVMYLLAGVLSIFSGSLTILIWLSCLLGAGCGLILPFSTGLIAAVFTGKYRTRQMGIISAIGNIALVSATFVAGFLAAKSWHLPFLVYLIPLVSLILLPWLNKIPKADLIPADGAASSSSHNQEAAAIPAIDEDGFPTTGQKVKGGFYIGRTVWLLFAYFTFIVLATIPAYYLPNLMPQYGLKTEEVSMAISILYLSMFLIGLGITAFMRFFKNATFPVAAALVVGGFVTIIFAKSLFPFLAGAAMIGLGTGLIQPTFYTKATQLVTVKSKSTLALAYLLSVNYVGISLVPVIMGALEGIFSNHSSLFPFICGGILALATLIITSLRVKHFVFGIRPGYYQ